MKFNFIDYLKNNARTEEDVKFAYIKEFNIPFSTRYKNDCRTDNILFEFKYDRNLSEEKKFAETLAQSLYYVYRAKYGIVEDKVPAYIILSDINESVIIESKNLSGIYTDPSFDWDRAPSTPDPKIVEEIIKRKIFKDVYVYKIQEMNDYKVFKEKITKLLSDTDTIVDSKIVSDMNFEEVFEHWDSVIGKNINKKEKAVYFIKDLQLSTFYDNSKAKIIFRFEDKIEEYSTPFKDYEYFWKVYKRPPSARDMESIISKADRLNHMSKRRFEGQFYTPLPFAKLGLEYIEKELGENYYKDYKIWDMACGTGNLEYYIPSYENVYMSTLDKNEVEHLKNNNLFPGATIFQYDYLNDDVDLVFSGADLLDDSLGWKMPRKLREDLANKDNKWLIYINPPFASEGGRVKKGTDKGKNISISKVKSRMIEDKLKNPSRELIGQFFYRIYKEIPSFTLSTFSTLKYLSDESFIPFYDYFKVKYERGFLFSSKNFEGTSGEWSISFIIWKKGNETLLNKKILVDVYSEEKEKIGLKNITIIPKDKRLNKWIERPKSNIKLPFSLSSAINVKYKEVYFTKDALGYQFVIGNDVSQQRGTALFSIPQASSAGGISLTQNNFIQNCVLNQVRQNIFPSWINNKDQFMQPNKPLSEEFINDSIIYALFHGSNQTSSLKDVECQGKIYQIRNQFFPYTIDTIKSFEIENPELYAQLRTAKDTYVANLLSSLTLSKEAQKVLDEGKKLYAMYFKEYNNLDRNKFKLDYWDVGWYQIRMSLKDKFGKDIFKDLNKAHKSLADKLRPQIYEYGFLDKEIIYENE